MANLKDFIKQNNVGVDLAEKFGVNPVKTITLPKHLGGGQFKTAGAGTLIETPRETNQAFKTQQRSEIDHIIPVALGGTSADPNLQELKNNPSFLERLRGETFIELKTKNRQEGKIVVELEAIKDYKAGKISLPEARLKVLRWRDEPPSKIDLAIAGVKKTFTDLGKKVKDIFKRDEEPLAFKVGEGLTEEEKQRAEQVIRKPAEIKQIGDSLMNFLARVDPHKPPQDTPPQMIKDWTVLHNIDTPEAKKEVVRLERELARRSIDLIGFGGTGKIQAKVGQVTKKTIAEAIDVGKKTISKELQPLATEARKFDTVNEFYERMPSKIRDEFRNKGIKGKEQIEKWWKDNNIPTKKDTLAGAMQHRPSKSGVASNIPQDILPDFYDRPNLYTFGGKEYDESVSILQKIKGKPESTVTIYRASPKNELRTGDWITFSKEKARIESLSENVPVQSFKVKVKDVQFAGDDITEFGYWGNKISDQAKGAK